MKYLDDACMSLFYERESADHGFHDMDSELNILQSRLSATYTTQQLALYVEWEAANERASADIREHYYKLGWQDAIQYMKENEEENQ